MQIKSEELDINRQKISIKLTTFLNRDRYPPR